MQIETQIVSLDIKEIRDKLSNPTESLVSEIKSLDWAKEWLEYDGKWFSFISPPAQAQDALLLLGDVLVNFELNRIKAKEGLWYIGNLYDECLRVYGDDFDISLICDITSKAYNTVTKAIAVYKAFKQERRFNLSYSHHNEVCFVNNLSFDFKLKVLDICEKHHLNSVYARNICNLLAKTADQELLYEQFNRCASKSDVDVLLDIFIVPKPKYLVFKENVVEGKMELNLSDFNEGKVIKLGRNPGVVVEFDGFETKIEPIEVKQEIYG